MRRTLGCLILLLLAGCNDNLPGKPKPPATLTDAEKAANLFATNCTGCHGEDGTFGPAPPIHDALFLAITPDAEIKKVLREGRKNTLMPSFLKSKGGTLTEAEMDLLTVELKKRWGDPALSTKEVPTYLANKSGDATAGKKVWVMACASCHGDQGQGRSAGAINDPAFLGLTSDQAIRRIIITGRADLGMPSYADQAGRSSDFKPLTENEVANLTAFIAAWRPVVGEK